MPVQVFISYARDDDEPPPGPETLPGFVKALYEHLRYQLKQVPYPRPELWRDVGKIERTDQFEEILETQVARSDFLIVVLSPNWLAREWCRRELESFHRRWAHEGDQKVRRRILLINKTLVDRGLRPPLLQGQEGHDFFDFDKEQRAGAQQRPYFVLGKVKDDRFVQNIFELASKLQRLTAEHDARPAAPVDTAVAAADASVRPNVRTIFVARPADDMRQPYERILRELKGRGFAVVPTQDIPHDNTAIGFIEAALAPAEVSIHLLGEKRGYAPAEEEWIVNLQLARAALRETASDPEKDKGLRSPFRRIIWAPKRVETGDEIPIPAGATERDPLAVLARFSELLDTDKIEGDTLTRFVDFLIRHLDQNAPQRATAAWVSTDAQIYLCHEPNDIGYADEIAEALQKRSITPVLPVLQGPRAQVDAFNRKRMRACDAVALCWGSATEIWAMSTASKLSQWRSLGRKERFASALLAAPPRDSTKERAVKIKPPEVDLVLDLTQCEKPLPRDFDPWLGPQTP